MAQYEGNSPFCHERGGLIINEISNGPRGAQNVKEYIEFVVVGSPNFPNRPVDLTGWIIDDNNFPGSGAGNQQGHLIFGPCYNAVPPGSIMVVYNGSDPNEQIPPPDPIDSNGDGVYIIPHLDPCIDACRSNPSLEDENYCPCPNLSAPVGWQFGLRNTGDVAQIRDACETLVQAIHWNGVSLVPKIRDTPVHFSIDDSGASQSNRMIHFANVINDDWHDVQNYENLDIVGNESPGRPNSSKNADFIDRIRDGVNPCSGTIFDCRDTDAGDLIVPNSVRMDPPNPIDRDSIRIEVCQGDDLDNFTTGYTEPDEFAPDAVGFTFEYAYLLTTNDAPTYTILAFNLNGDFDFSGLDLGIYVVWGFSYIQTNGAVSVSDFLGSPNASSIEAIQNFEACGYHADMDNQEAGFYPMRIRIIEQPIATPPNDIIAACGDESIVDLTVLNEQILSGQSTSVSWFLDQEGQQMIDEPDSFMVNQNIVFAAAGTNCLSNTVPVTIETTNTIDFELQITQPLSCVGANDAIIEVALLSTFEPQFVDWNVDQWDGNLQAMDLGPGLYTVEVSNKEGCSQIESIEIEPRVEFTFDCSLNQAGEESSIIMNINGGTPPYNLIYNSQVLEIDAPGQLEFTDLNPSEPVITIEDQNGCSLECNFELIEPNDTNQVSRKYYLPNVFSPNGDGINDFFTLFSDPGAVESIKFLRIFDRWGNLVFERENLSPGVENQGWDGKFQGQVMNNAVFVYYAVLTFRNAEEEAISGEIMLLR